MWGGRLAWGKEAITTPATRGLRLQDGSQITITKTGATWSPVHRDRASPRSVGLNASGRLCGPTEGDCGKTDGGCEATDSGSMPTNRDIPPLPGNVGGGLTTGDWEQILHAFKAAVGLVGA